MKMVSKMSDKVMLVMILFWLLLILIIEFIGGMWCIRSKFIEIEKMLDTVNSDVDRLIKVLEDAITKIKK